MNTILKTLAPILLLLILSKPTFSQDQQDLSKYDLSTLKVDELSDDQVGSFMTRAEQSGMTEQQLEQMALSRGMQPTEIEKLRKRVEKIKEEKGATNDSDKFRNRERKYSDEKYLTEKENIDKRINEGNVEKSKNETANLIFGILKSKEKAELVKLEEKIFGFSLFNYKRLDFEPSLNLATPQNYQIGPGDELIIDVWGASQQTYQQKITTEGYVLISNVGPIFISGMTIEEATGKIKKDLSNIYAGLRGTNPNTFIKVSLGSLRSIKVNIVGDVFFPGTYTLSSLATVFNALYAAGGISVNGSLRNIKVVRNEKTVAELDLYDFLLKGEQKGNIRLQDQDVIFIGPYINRVEIKGEVKRPALYDMKDKETIKNLLYFAGGFTGKSYSRRFKLIRKTLQENKIFDVSNTEIDTFYMVNGDELEVDSILNRFENRVEIKGAVYRPGIFSLDNASTLKQLIKKAEGLRGDAFKNRASIYRTKDDLTMEVIPVDLSVLMNDSVASDIKLQREDLIVIPSIFDLKEEYSIQIEGEVRRPGIYPYVANATVEDIILQSGGLLESASFARLEIARRVKNRMAENSSNQIAEIYQFQISQDLMLSNAASKFTLQPFDQIFIRRSPGYMIQALVKVEGEVAFPGTYSIANKAERISDLVKRAGGLTPEAYPKGARIVRKLPVDEQMRAKALKRLKELIRDSVKIEYLYENESAIGISLDKILAEPQSELDLFLQEGDVLRIPKQLQTVRISGEVLYPVIVRFDKRNRFRSYIAGAGGFSSSAKRSKTYVIYANGSVDQTSKILFFNHFPKIEPGAEIVIPKKPERKGLSTGEAVSLGSAVASLSLIIITIINALK